MDRKYKLFIHYHIAIPIYVATYIAVGDTHRSTHVLSDKSSVIANSPVKVLHLDIHEANIHVYCLWCIAIIKFHYMCMAILEIYDR